MGFITSIDVAGIDSPEAMCRALRCMAVDLFNPISTRVYLEDDDDSQAPPEARNTSFIIEDQGGDDYRVTITYEASPRPVQLGESSRKVLDLAREIGTKTAIGLIESFRAGRIVAHNVVVSSPDGTERVASTIFKGQPDTGDAPTDSERFLVRTIRASGLDEKEAVARLFPTAIGGDDGAINRLLARLIAVSSKWNAIDALAASIKGFVESSERIPDDDADAILAEVSAIEAEAKARAARVADENGEPEPDENGDDVADRPGLDQEGEKYLLRLIKTGGLLASKRRLLELANKIGVLRAIAIIEDNAARIPAETPR